MKNIFAAIFLVLASLNVFANGGATTVGDGGHSVTCDGKTELFDLFEYRVNSGTLAPITLKQHSGASIREMTAVGLARISERFTLSAPEFARVKRATDLFFFDNQNVDSWKNTYLYSAAPMTTSIAVAEKLQRKRCIVETVVVRPAQNGFFRAVCNHNMSGFEFCFLTSQSGYSKLGPQNRACLVLHEALRFLPLAKAPATELDLRYQASQICTE